MRPALRTFLFWFVRVPVGVVAAVALFLLWLAVAGAAVAVGSWSLPGGQGKALAVGTAALLGLGLAAVVRRRFRDRLGRPASWWGGAGVGSGALAALVALVGWNVCGTLLAAYALGYCGSPAVPLLVRAAEADDKASPVAVSALARLGPAVVPAADYLIARQRTEAVVAVGTAAVPGLVAALSDPDPGRRYWAAKCLERVPVPAVWAVPLAEALARAKSGEDPPLAAALVRMGPEAAPAVPTLRRLLKSHGPTRCETAAEVLAAVGPPAADAVPDLIEALRQDQMAHWTIRALGAVGPAAVDPLRELIRSAPPTTTLAEGCLALGFVGPAAAAALPDLKPLLRSEDGFVRFAAASAWLRVGGPAADAVPVLLTEHRRGDYSCFLLLKEMGPAGVALLPDYVRLLREPVAAMRDHGAALLGSLGPAAAPAVADLTAVVRNDPIRGVRGEAVRALRKIGPAAAGAAPAVRDAAPELLPNDRLDAALAVAELGRDAGPLADWLRLELSDDRVRLWALTGGQTAGRAVVALGRDARPVVPVLEEAYRRGKVSRPELVRLLGPVDPVRAFWYDTDAQAVAVGLLMLACLVVELVVFRRRGRAASQPEPAR